MQIFPTAPLNPQCYCTWWPCFSLRGLDARWQKSFARMAIGFFGHR
jgi:hypothetical protein